VALPLTAVSSQNVIGSFEARFFLRSSKARPTSYLEKVTAKAAKTYRTSDPAFLCGLGGFVSVV